MHCAGGRLRIGEWGAGEVAAAGAAGGQKATSWRWRWLAVRRGEKRPTCWPRSPQYSGAKPLISRSIHSWTTSTSFTPAPSNWLRAFHSLIACSRHSTAARGGAQAKRVSGCQPAASSSEQAVLLYGSLGVGTRLCPETACSGGRRAAAELTAAGPPENHQQHRAVLPQLPRREGVCRVLAGLQGSLGQGHGCL